LGEQKGLKWHLGGDKIHTARLKGVCRQCIHIQDSGSCIEREKELKVQDMYFVLEKWREDRRI